MARSTGIATITTVERVDYTDTFIAVAEDCPASKGTPPPFNPENASVSARTYQTIVEHPYAFTSGDVIFAIWGIHADAHGRLALYGVETSECAKFVSKHGGHGSPGALTRAMRSPRS